MTEQELFAGANRATKYQEPATRDSSLDERLFGSADGPVIRNADPVDESSRSETAVASPARRAEPGEIELWRAARHEPAKPSGWKTFLARLGMAAPPPSPEDLADAENERIVRQSTWTRAMNVLVVNPKGSSAKTPMTLLVAAALADIRGGGVVATEATEVPGDLADRAEGTPPRGLSELLTGVDTVTSAGTLAGYTAPQTSHAAVIGSVTGRPEMAPDDVARVRQVLDTYYQVVVTDTGNNLQSATFRTALALADAVVIPCVINQQSVRGLQRAVTTVANLRPDLLDRTVLVVSHDGGPEDLDFAASTPDALRRHYGVREVVEIPFDPAIRRDGELVYGDLATRTRNTVRLIARHVVEAFNAAPEVAPKARSAS